MELCEAVAKTGQHARAAPDRNTLLFAKVLGALGSNLRAFVNNLLTAFLARNAPKKRQDLQSAFKPVDFGGSSPMELLLPVLEPGLGQSFVSSAELQQYVDWKADGSIGNRHLLQQVWKSYETLFLDYIQPVQLHMCQ